MKRKYRRITDDLTEVVEGLEQAPESGDAITGYEQTVWKIRCRSTDMRRGQSGGFRLIYFWPPESQDIYLLLVYAKSEKSDVTAAELDQLLQALREELAEEEALTGRVPACDKPRKGQVEEQ
jgi:hypothetical protein